MATPFGVSGPILRTPGWPRRGASLNPVGSPWPLLHLLHFRDWTLAPSAVASGRALTLLSKIATQFGPTTKEILTDEWVFCSSEHNAAFAFGVCLARTAWLGKTSSVTPNSCPTVQVP